MQDRLWMILSLESSKPYLDTVFVKAKDKSLKSPRAENDTTDT
jgi:hypothetical protein